MIQMGGGGAPLTQNSVLIVALFLGQGEEGQSRLAE
jgi:hypothetical protein